MEKERSQYQGPGRYGRERFQPRVRKHPALPEGFSLFYIAILCPPAIDEKISGFKAYMEQQYGSRSAQKSPAHLTLIPPFRAEDETESALADFVQSFSIGMAPIDIQLAGFGHFADRVLYVDLAPNQALFELEKEANAEFSEKFPAIIFGQKPEFSPHVTIATRDIPEGKLPEALEYFNTHQQASEVFSTREINLLKLDKGFWKIVA